jgi:hypothetical protein
MESIKYPFFKFPKLKEAYQFDRLPFLLGKSEDNAMTALWVLPLDILVRTAYTAAAALMATFVSDMHSDLLPFIYFRRAKDGT